MELFERCTYFRCRNCKKDVTKLNTNFGKCAECKYLEARNIFSIKDYNNYLKKG
jgi:hypothetical protein